MFSQATSNGFPHTGFPQSSAGFPQAGSAGFPQADSSGFSQAASNGFPQTLLGYPQAAVGIPQGGQIITRPPVGTIQPAAGAHPSSALPPFLTPQQVARVQQYGTIPQFIPTWIAAAPQGSGFAGTSGIGQA